VNRQVVRDRIAERYGALVDRLRERVGRAVGSCRTCGKPTRSHTLGSGVQCHACRVAGERVVAADGGTPPPSAGPTPTPAEWARVIAAVEPPTASQVAAGLADGTAYDLVEEALVEGVLAEVDTGGMFPEVEAVGASPAETETGGMGEEGGSGSGGYAAMFDAAQRRAGV